MNNAKDKAIMKYVYVNADGVSINLQVRSSKDGVTVLEEQKIGPVAISAQEWVADVLKHIESTGAYPATAVEHVIDFYQQKYRHKGGYERQPIPREMLQDCVNYFESLREEALADLEDSAWAHTNPFTSAQVLKMFGTKVAS